MVKRGERAIKKKTQIKIRAIDKHPAYEGMSVNNILFRKTHLTVQTAVFLSLKQPLSRLPCHTYFPPAALEHCPMNMS